MTKTNHLMILYQNHHHPTLFVFFLLIIFFHSILMSKKKKRKLNMRRLLFCGLISMSDWNKEKRISFLSITIKMRGNKLQCSCSFIVSFLLSSFRLLSFPRTDIIRITTYNETYQCNSYHFYIYMFENNYLSNIFHYWSFFDIWDKTDDKACSIRWRLIEWNLFDLVLPRRI